MKRIKKSLLILFFIFLFVPFITVKADDCSIVQHEVNKLEELETNYKELDCDNAEDNSKLSECNMIKVSKSSSLEKIFKYNDEKTCPSIDLSRIISEYSGVCSNEFSSTIKDISDKVMNLFFISAPFLLIILGSLDFFKIVTNGSPDEIKKSRSNFIKRVAAFLLLYLAPLVVKTLFSITPYDMNGTSYICAEIIDLNAKISSTGVKGIYVGYKGGYGAFGISDGSTYLTLDCSSSIYKNCEEEEYVVVDTNYPGGIESFTLMLQENDIAQDSDGAWLGCCLGFAAAQGCGLYKGQGMYLSDLPIEKGNSNCNWDLLSGCIGAQTFTPDYCFETEQDYMLYIIDNIRSGIPVYTVVEGPYGRHFVTVIGFKASTDATDADDLLFLDSYDALIAPLGNSTRGKGDVASIERHGSEHPCGPSNANTGNWWASPVRLVD